MRDAVPLARGDTRGSVQEVPLVAAPPGQSTEVTGIPYSLSVQEPVPSVVWSEVPGLVIPATAPSVPSAEETSALLVPANLPLEETLSADVALALSELLLTLFELFSLWWTAQHVGLVVVYLACKYARYLFTGGEEQCFSFAQYTALRFFFLSNNPREEQVGGHKSKKSTS